MHRVLGMDFRLHRDDAGVGISIEMRGVGQERVGILEAKAQAALTTFFCLEAELRQKRCAFTVPQDHPWLTRERPCGLRRNRQIRVLVEHAAGDIDRLKRLQLTDVFVVRQRRPPINNFRETRATRG